MAKLSDQIEKITNEETGVARLKCKLCLNEYNSASLMMKHLEEHKKGTLLLKKCRKCGATFKDRFMLAKHKLLHGSENTMVETEKSLIEHAEVIMTDEGQRKFRCKLCPDDQEVVAFRELSTLKKHLAAHKNGTALCYGNNKKFKCDECGVLFKFKRELKLHWATHWPELHDR